jgi:ATP-dependent protease ClpP protease subunit
MADEQLIPIFPQKNIFTTEVRGQQHTYYLTGPITEPENYVDLCNTLRSSSPQDEIIIRINSCGGHVSSERMIVNAIQESQANVKGFIEYNCMSAATGIFLACREHDRGEHIQFMAHCAWWGAIGKNPDIKSQTEFGLKQMEEEINSTYSGLLSPEELVLCNNGKEYWFGAQELDERMVNFYTYQKENSKVCNDPDCTSCGEGPEASLESIIQEAVQKGVQAALSAERIAVNKAALTAEKAAKKLK